MVTIDGGTCTPIAVLSNENTIVNLKKIEINGLLISNVEAAIIDSDSAPLLLGQSALNRLGKVQIDFKNSTLTLIR